MNYIFERHAEYRSWMMPSGEEDSVPFRAPRTLHGQCQGPLRSWLVENTTLRIVITCERGIARELRPKRSGVRWVSLPVVRQSRGLRLLAPRDTVRHQR
jgi:hypothetical protein